MSRSRPYDLELILSLIDELVSTNVAQTIVAPFIICLAQDKAYEC